MQCPPLLCVTEGQEPCIIGKNGEWQYGCHWTLWDTAKLNPKLKPGQELGRVVKNCHLFSPSEPQGSDRGPLLVQLLMWLLTLLCVTRLKNHVAQMMQLCQWGLRCVQWGVGAASEASSCLFLYFGAALHLHQHKVGQDWTLSLING